MEAMTYVLETMKPTTEVMVKERATFKGIVPFPKTTPRWKPMAKRAESAEPPFPPPDVI